MRNLFAISFTLLLIGCSNPAKSPESKSAVLDLKSRAPDITVEAKALMTECKEHRLTMNDKYKGMIVQVTGTMLSPANEVATGAEPAYDVGIYRAEAYSWVAVEFPKTPENARALEALFVGAALTAKCGMLKCSDGKEVELHPCVLVR